MVRGHLTPSLHRL